MRINRKFFASIFIALFVSQSFIEYHTKVAQATMQPGMYPGMMLRVDESSIVNFKDAMTLFLPHYFNVDLQLPTEYGF